MQEGHDTPTGDDETTFLEDRVQDGMSTHDGGNDNRTGSAGQAQAQVHPKEKFAEEPAGRRADYRGAYNERHKRSKLLFW